MNAPITDFYKTTLAKVITNFGSPFWDPCNLTFREVKDAYLSCAKVSVKLEHSSNYQVGEWDTHNQVGRLLSLVTPFLSISFPYLLSLPITPVKRRGTEYVHVDKSVHFSV